MRPVGVSRQLGPAALGEEPRRRPQGQPRLVLGEQGVVHRDVIHI